MGRAATTLRYVLKRLLLSLPTLLIAAIFVFALIRMIPGDPAQVMLGPDADAEAVAALHQQMGLDRPLAAQFLTWIAHAARGDLGVSAVTGEAVLPLLLQRFQVTASLVVSAVALATLIALVFGLVAASRRGRHIDSAIVAGSALSMAVPSFWLGLMLLLVFGVKLQWLPVVGFVPLKEHFGLGLLYLILPVATLAIVESGVLTRMMRESALDVLRLEYVTHARAKGVSEPAVLVKHVLPNAFAPTLTLVGLTLGHLLGGAAVIETVFTLPGLGRLIVDSILARDYAVVQGCLLFTALVYVLINLAVDLCYPLLDPRVTVEG
ncbi:ABC transporter permease [Phenylobacterium sp.]|jgi:peptide/nickel transport system permease protein|uniref:ABC transporter permease n=1 Tax=Phenylobacterium sp. TaxID=1871053 RepID=UPI002F3F605C